MDRAAAERALAEFLGTLEVPDGEVDVAQAANAIAAAYAEELLVGYARDPREHLRVEFANGPDDLVVVRDVPFTSLCSHHLLPFHGHAHVAYLPAGKLTGFSAIARVVEGYARRLQSQERLTRQVATALVDRLAPRGVACRIEATQLCVTARGAAKAGIRTVTECLLGAFETDPEAARRWRELLGGTGAAASAPGAA